MTPSLGLCPQPGPRPSPAYEGPLVNPPPTFSSKAAMRSLRWSCRRSLDSLNSRSTVSDSRLLWSSFIFSRWRTYTEAQFAPDPTHSSSSPTGSPFLHPGMQFSHLWSRTLLGPPWLPHILTHRLYNTPPHPSTLLLPHPGQLLVLFFQLALQLPQVLLDVAMPLLSLGQEESAWLGIQHTSEATQLLPGRLWAPRSGTMLPSPSHSAAELLPYPLHPKHPHAG